MKFAIRFAVFACLSCAALSGWAQTSEQNPIRDLSFLIGTWEASSVAQSDLPELKIVKGDTINTRIENRWLAGGNAMEMNIQRGDEDSFQPSTSEMIVWDPESKRLKHKIFSEQLAGSGEWKKVSDGVWHLRWKATTNDGDVYEGTSVHRAADDGTWEWQLVDYSVNGKALPDTENAKHHRVLPSTGPGQEKMQALAFLVGEWEEVDQNGQVSTRVCRWINNQAFIECRNGDYLEILGWDPVSESYKSWAFGTAGGIGTLDMEVGEGTIRYSANPYFYDRWGNGIKAEFQITMVGDDELVGKGHFGSVMTSVRAKRVKKADQ